MRLVNNSFQNPSSMNKILFASVMLLFVVASFAQPTQYTRSGRHGVWMEVLADTTNPCRFTEDNLIYKEGREFTYQFRYFNALGKEQYMKYVRIPKEKFEISTSGDTLDSYVAYYPDFVFTDIFDVSDSCTNRYKIKVKCQHRVFGADYDQTVEEFLIWIDGNYKALSWSGIVENERNLWMHPNRSCLFRVLELNPFPYIQYPVKKGKSWKWKLTIGSQWGDSRWKEWEETIVNRYKYKITDLHCEVKTLMGTMSCVKTESVARSRIGKTFLTSYYNDQYGFVRMENTNIDGSRIVVDLVEVK